MTKKTSSSDFLCDYPYRGDQNQLPLAIVSNWCTAGGLNHLALVKDYLASTPSKRLAAIIKANWRVKATLEQLEQAAAFYREQVIKS